MLSKKLIAEIQVRLAKHYRAQGYPFVSIFTPEQDISAGVLRIQIVEFRIGDIRVTGGTAKADADFKARIGLKSGDSISAGALADDLYWLNLYPFTQTRAVFAPAQATGTTDLSLVRTATRPWQVYAGYENSGSLATGTARYFLGGSLGGLLGRESVLSYQVTGSADALRGQAHPDYVGHALNYALPLMRHARIELSLNHVETNQNADPFLVQRTIDEAELAYRFGVSGLMATGNTQLRLGLAVKRQGGVTRYGGVTVYKAAVGDYLLVSSLSHGQTRPGLSTNWSVTLRASPGGLSKANDRARALFYRQGQSSNARYAYLGLTYDRQHDLNANWVWHSQIVGQWTHTALPRTEQSGLGGASLVRGYNVDDGAFDQAAIWRNELGPQVGFGLKSVRVLPYAFVDWGYGRDLFDRKSRDLASIGAGADFALDRNVSLRLALADRLRKGLVTPKGTGQAHIGLTVRF